MDGINFYPHSHPLLFLSLQHISYFNLKSNGKRQHSRGKQEFHESGVFYYFPSDSMCVMCPQISNCRVATRECRIRNIYFFIWNYASIPLSFSSSLLYTLRSADAQKYCFEPDATRELWTLLLMEKKRYWKGMGRKHGAQWIDKYWLSARKMAWTILSGSQSQSLETSSHAKVQRSFWSHQFIHEQKLP